MRRLLPLFALCAVLFPGSIMARPRPVPNPIAILVEGLVLSDGKAVALGQHLSTKSKLTCGPDASVHVVWDRVTSFVLDANSELSGTKLEHGTLYWMSEPGTRHVVLASKTAVLGEGCHFQVDCNADEAWVRVSQGELEFRTGVSNDMRIVNVKALESARYFNGRLEKASRLPKREAGELRNRWQRYELFHRQRRELLKQFK